MVELSETSKILHQATPRSLVILDELGRGTSTFDGYAIAYSVLHHLAHRVRCLGLFSTHYGLLTSEYTAPACPTPAVRCMHMSCQVNETTRSILFLYKLVDGVSEGSYGMHVAQLAGVPSDVIDVAERKSRQMVHEKGWIGCVGVKSNQQEAPSVYDEDTPMVEQQLSRSLMVQSDFALAVKLAKQAVDQPDQHSYLLQAIVNASKARFCA